MVVISQLLTVCHKAAIIATFERRDLKDKYYGGKGEATKGIYTESWL